MPKIVDHEERRRLIVEALWRVVSRDGAAAVSVRNVAAEAGMPKSSIGHYVGTMPQLLSLAIAQMVTFVRAQSADMDRATIDVDKATDAMMTLVPTDTRRRQMSEVWLLLLSQRNAEPELAPILSDLNAQVLEGLTEGLTALRSQGLVDPSRDLGREARVLHALIDGLAVQSLTDPDSMPKSDVRDIIKAQLRGLSEPR